MKGTSDKIGDAYLGYPQVERSLLRSASGCEERYTCSYVRVPSPTTWTRGRF